MTEPNNQSLGPYQIIEEIGRGGMANVYRAVQPSIGREVALKVLPAQFLQDATFLDRFMREVQVIAALQHPRILPVHDYGEHDGRPYIVMALMTGGTLLSRIRRYPLGMPVQEVKHIVAQIAEGLDFAHRRGVIHRDFKPTNLLFDEEDNVYLSDFGIAKIAESTAAATQGQFYGTPGYMAPELAEPGDATPAVDMYALGVTLFEMLTSSPPYDADTPMRLMYMHVNQPVPDIRTFRAELPDGMEYIIQRAMAKDPADRYATAAELASELSEVASETWTGPAANWQAWRERQQEETREFMAASGGAHDQVTLESQLEPGPETLPVPHKSSGSRLPLLAGIGGLLLLAVIAIVLFVVLPGGSQTPAANEPALPTSAVDDSPADESPAELADENPPESLASMGSTVEPLTGTVELRVGHDGVFEPLDVLWLVYPGDAVRTGPDGHALFFITEGIYAEVGPNSELALERSEPTDVGWAASLFQFAGLGSYAVAIDAGMDFSVQTSVGAVFAEHAMYWIEEQSGGWCFVPTQGEILLEVGEADSNPDDDLLLSADNADSVLVDFDAVHVGGQCAIQELIDASQTSSNASSQSGEVLSSTAVPIEDPCADHGGLQWQGDSCACSGVITAVIICNDGTKWDSPTEQTCTPGCDAAGGGGGGSGGGSLCGNGQVDSGEECDPPGSQGLWCGSGTSYYFCTQSCVWSSMCKNF